MKRNVDFYVKKRNELIDLLDEEKITKQEFISRNNVLINSFNLRPFTDIKTVNEGVFNYQYYRVICIFRHCLCMFAQSETYSMEVNRNISCT